jgi:hypothetical protein
MENQILMVDMVLENLVFFLCLALPAFGRIFSTGSSTATSPTPRGGPILSQAQGNFQGPAGGPFSTSNGTIAYSKGAERNCLK